MGQKQQVDAEQIEVENTLNELQKTPDPAVIYKAIGSLLVKAEKTKVTEDLVERKELLTTRTTVLARQEERLRSQVKEVQTKLQEDLNPQTPAPS
jgi:prefoldin beta subunit